MVRFAAIVATAGLLAGCAINPVQLGTGAENTTVAGLAASANPAFTKSHRSGLGVADAAATPDTTGQQVAVDASRKAPKGALADRDYSATKLDPQHEIGERRVGKEC